MALRRLMSGWLIALAAMARATASALERAAERSAPAVDPAMAALVERYPDAPAHWLAFVAERMSQAADAVEMSSAPVEGAAERVSAPESFMAITPDSMFTDAPPPSASPIAPGFRPVRRREEVAAPSLAELASRSSEVWRRPGMSPNRPSRPVFARPAEAPAPTMAAAPRKDAPTTVRRLRSPLTVDPRAASRIRPDRPSMDDASFDMRPSGVSPPLAACMPNEESSVGRVAPASISTRPTPTPTKERPPRNAGSIDALPMTGEAAREEPPGARLAPAASRTDPEAARRGPFLDPTSPSLLPPEPSSREAMTRAARPPPCPPTVSDAEARHSRRGRARPLAALRSAARRAIVQTVAALRPRVAFASHRQVPATAPPSIAPQSVAPPTVIRRPRRSTSPSAPTLATTGENSTAPMEIRAPRAEDREAFVETAPWSPHRRTAHVGGDTIRDEPPSARRPELRAREFAPAFTPEPAPRPSFAARRASPALGRTHAAATPSDDRWPLLPPSAPPPTPEVEAPTPRLTRLARDQEEGLWSA